MKLKLELVFRVFIGIVFIFSAYSKLISPGLTEIILVDQGLVASRETAAVVVRLLIGFEFALGLLFFQPFSLKRIVIPISFLFLLAFSGYLAYTGFILKDSQNCGCFGEMIEMSPVESIIKNVILIGLLMVFYKLASERKNYFVAPVIIIFSIAAILIAVPIKSQKDFKFAQYTNFEERGRVDLSNGDKLVLILNTECDHCQNLVKDLNLLKQKEKWFPEIYALLFSEGVVSIDSFKTLTGFNFPYRMINTKEFFDLIGQSPPRIYRLHGGVIKEIWDKDFVQVITQKFSYLTSSN